MKLWLRLALVVAAVAIALVALTAWGAISVSTGKATRSSRAVLEQEAHSLADNIAAWVADRQANLLGWSTPFQLSTEAHGLGLLRSVYLANPSVVTAVLVDPEDGTWLVEPVYAHAELPSEVFAGRIPGSPERTQSLGRRLPLSEVAEGGAAVGEPYLPPGETVPSLPVAARQAGGAWVLGVEVSMDTVGDLVLGQSSEQHAVVLVDGNGRPVFGGGHPLVEVDKLTPFLGNDVPTFDQVLGNERQVTGALAPVQGTTWSLAVVAPEEVAQRAALEIRRVSLQLLVVAFALAILAGLLTARSVARPVARLRDSALAVAEGDYGRRVEAERGDELGDLARAFNHMTERLELNDLEIRAQRQEIEAFNRELQQRVDERTQQLEAAQERLVRTGQLAAVAQLGAGLAHELNNPLAGILGLTQVLRARATQDDSRALLQSIEDQAERCRQVVDAMLRASRGEVDPQDVPVIEIDDVLVRVLEAVRVSFEQSQVGLQHQPSTASVGARVHSAHAERILVQLLDSLRAGLPEGSSLVASTSLQGEQAVIQLQVDAGIAHDSSSRDDWMASGMALWVARQMLARVGGHLDQPDGAGTWRVCFPGVGLA